MDTNLPVINFKNVTKKFLLKEDRTFREALPNLLLGKPWAKEISALSDLSFEINKGEAVGIVGKNGAGKSTLLKLIAGVTSPSKGKITIHGKVAPLIELGAGFHYDLSGYENIFLNAAILGMHKKEIESVADKIIEFSELKEFIHYPVKKYSLGMYMRLAFAVAIHVDAPILLIDEILAVGDAEFQKKCLDFLNQYKKQGDKIIVFVSHSEEAIENFCDRALLLQHGKLIADDHPKKILEKYNKILKESTDLGTL